MLPVLPPHVTSCIQNSVFRGPRGPHSPTQLSQTLQCEVLGGRNILQVKQYFSFTICPLIITSRVRGGGRYVELPVLSEGGKRENGDAQIGHGPCHWGATPERMWSGTESRGQRTNAGTNVRNCLQTHTHSGLGLCSNLT